MRDRTAQLYALIVEVRAAFNAFKVYADQANADLGVTAAMRAMMEHIAGHGAGTVPDIARAKNVSRQHVQLLMDALTALGLVEWQDNPRHKRSPLAALTARGKAQFDHIRQRETKVLADLANDLEGLDFDAAANTILRVRQALKQSG